MRHVIIWIVSIVVVIGLAGWLVSAFVLPRFAGGPTQETKVWVQTVTKGDLTEVVSAPGVVEPLTKVEISARVSARIVRLPHKEGDRVSGDQASEKSLLVELDASDIKAQLESAQKRREGLIAQIGVEKKRITSLEASLTGTKTVLDDLVRELARQVSLRKSGDVSAKSLEQAQRAADEMQSRYNAESASLEAAQLGLEVSRFNVEAADADIRQIREALGYTTIRSPIEGIVTRLNVDVGEIAITGTMNNPGTVLLEVADLSRMLVVARIDEANIRDVQPGQIAYIRLSAYPGQTFEGSVQSVALAATREQGQYFETKVLLEENDLLQRTGLSADVEIEVRSHRDVVLVPSQAVVSLPVESLPADIRKDNPLIDPTRANTIVVFRIVDGKAVATPVRMGASDSLNTLILEGLEPDAQIVTGPYAVLESLSHGASVGVSRRDGVEVKVEKAKPDASPSTPNEESGD